MAEMINLRLARKARARSTAQGAAAANRAKFGQTKADKAASGQDAERTRCTIDGALIERDEP